MLCIIKHIIVRVSVDKLTSIIWRPIIESANLPSSHVIGEEALEIYNTLEWSERGDENEVSKIMEKFEAYASLEKTSRGNDTCLIPETNKLERPSTNTSPI